MKHVIRGWNSICATTASTILLAAPATTLAEQHASADTMPVERARILKDPGVFGVFSLFKLRPEWGMLDADSRNKAAAEIKAVIERHKDRVVVDAYLTRGVSESADFFLRSHAYELSYAQSLVNEIMATSMGTHAVLVNSFVGVTKPLNYVTEAKAPDLLKQLQAASYEGAPPKYVIVIPTKKNADWWNLPEEARLAEIVAHTVPTLEFLTSVNRKLYHASGLDDLDFVTYFETNDLVAFNNMVIALLSIRENTYNVQMGSPTLLGTIHEVDEVLKVLSQ